jgi:hypothetical protein
MTGGACFSACAGSTFEAGEGSDAEENSVVRRSEGESARPSSKLRFQTHCARMRAKLLAPRRMRVALIRVLLYVLISKRRFKRPAMQVKVEYIRGGKSRRGKRAHK